jgi:lysozyme family protein
MADDAVEFLISRVIDREGGFVNDPTDRGGATKYGITIGTLAAYRGHAVTVPDVKDMTELEARKIYRANYFRGIDAVTDPKSLEFLFDYAVNAGTGKATKALQFVIGAVEDGDFGPNSKKKLAEYGDQSKLYWPLVCYRFDHFMRIMANDPSQTKFANGWANRMKEFWVPKKV